MVALLLNLLPETKAGRAAVRLMFLLAFVGCTGPVYAWLSFEATQQIKPICKVADATVRDLALRNGQTPPATMSCPTINLQPPKDDH